MRSPGEAIRGRARGGIIQVKYPPTWEERGHDLVMV
jgi:hypothetical protein